MINTNEKSKKKAYLAQKITLNNTFLNNITLEEKIKNNK